MDNKKYIAQEQLISATLDNYIHKIVHEYPLYVDCHQPYINALKVVS